jgi:hypothetical protein
MPDPIDRRGATWRSSLHRNRISSKKNRRIRSAGALRSSSRKGHGSAVAKKGEIEEREERLAAGGETGCDLYCLCVEMATAQNPPHLSIFRGFWSSAGLVSC